MELTREGYGVVEDNHLSAKRSGHVYGQLPAAEDIEILENGMYVRYDKASGVVRFGDGVAPWMMVYNEEKLYDERKQMHKDYVMKKEDFYDGVMTPRVIAIEVGDLYTTNMFDDSVSEITIDDPENPPTFVINTENGKLEAGTDGDIVLAAVKCYTMPDGQPGVQLQCVKAQ